MKFRRRQRDNVEIGLAPLIDVVFILLLFFVVTTTFTRETRLKVDLPEAVSGTPSEEAEMRPLEVLIGADGSFSVNGNALVKSDLSSLMTSLQRESEGDTSLPLTISADGKSPHQSVVIAMDAAGKLGFSRLRIATIEAQATP